MVDLLTLHKQFLTPHLKKGGIAVDFTMGNGHDTLWLAEQVGETGKVYAFDIQPQALENSERLLRESGCPKNYTLILDSHANVEQYVKEPICAGMFNLGYLPGSDKKITTMRDTTLAAIDAAIELMDKDAIILIAVYPGHAEGDIEGQLVGERLSKLDRKLYTVACFKMVNSPTSPFFYIIEGR